MNLTLYQLSYFALPKEVPYPSVGISILYVGYPLRGHIIQSLRIIDSLLPTVGTCGTVSIGGHLFVFSDFGKYLHSRYIFGVE